MAVCNSGIVHYKLNRRNNKATNIEKFIRQLITELKSNESYSKTYYSSDFVLVMDNASIHRGSEVKSIIEASRLRVLFLPPYSPQFNPIEKVFALMKNGFYRNVMLNM